MSGKTPRHPLADTTGASAGSRAPTDAPVRFTQRVGEQWFEWSVREVETAGVPGARGPRCLLFTRESCIRRVWDFPADWRTLDTAELAALSWRR